MFLVLHYLNDRNIYLNLDGNKKNDRNLINSNDIKVSMNFKMGCRQFKIGI